MKKQLLITLLAFTPFFTAAKPANAQLLAHLKNVRTELLDNLESIKKEGVSPFVFNLLDEFYNASKFLHKYVSHGVNDEFKLICNMATLEDIAYSPIGKKPMVITGTDIKKLSQLFESIYTKLHQDYCNDNPNGELVNVTAQDMFEDVCLAVFYYDGIVMTQKLLEKIDAKIAELSLPFEALAK
jgi:hypothetical protein